jgi:hypothetical protein
MPACSDSAACRCGIVSVTVESQTMVELMGSSVDIYGNLQMEAY